MYGAEKLLIVKFATLYVEISHSCYCPIEFEFVNQCLQRTHVCIADCAHQHFGMFGAYLEPLILMLAQLFGMKLAPAWVIVVVTVNLCVAFETDRNRIIDFVAATTLCWIDVIRFDLDAAKSMADAATPVALSEKCRNFVS